MNFQQKIGKTYWFDLPVSDVVNARSFYEGLFDWKFLFMDDAPIQNYWVIQAGQELIGGIRQIKSKNHSENVPILYFTVDDLKRYCHRVVELGGKLVEGPVDLGKGRGAYQWFRDREGNLVALWAPTRESV